MALGSVARSPANVFLTDFGQEDGQEDGQEKRASFSVLDCPPPTIRSTTQAELNNLIRNRKKPERVELRAPPTPPESTFKERIAQDYQEALLILFYNCPVKDELRYELERDLDEKRVEYKKMLEILKEKANAELENIWKLERSLEFDREKLDRLDLDDSPELANVEIEDIEATKPRWILPTELWQRLPSPLISLAVSIAVYSFYSFRYFRALVNLKPWERLLSPFISLTVSMTFYYLFADLFTPTPDQSPLENSSAFFAAILRFVEWTSWQSTSL
jgi:hypothetical protein